MTSNVTVYQFLLSFVLRVLISFFFREKINFCGLALML